MGGRVGIGAVLRAERIQDAGVVAHEGKAVVEADGRDAKVGQVLRPQRGAAAEGRRHNRGGRALEGRPVAARAGRDGATREDRGDVHELTVGGNHVAEALAGQRGDSLKRSAEVAARVLIGRVGGAAEGVQEQDDLAVGVGGPDALDRRPGHALNGDQIASGRGGGDDPGGAVVVGAERPGVGEAGDGVLDRSEEHETLTDGQYARGIGGLTAGVHFNRAAPGRAAGLAGVGLDRDAAACADSGGGDQTAGGGHGDVGMDAVVGRARRVGQGLPIRDSAGALPSAPIGRAVGARDERGGALLAAGHAGTLNHDRRGLCGHASGPEAAAVAAAGHGQAGARGGGCEGAVRVPHVGHRVKARVHDHEGGVLRASRGGHRVSTPARRRGAQPA